MISPYHVVKDFESALCEYTGSKYAVTVTSCTMALLLACRWAYLNDPGLAHLDSKIVIPNRTYVGVPMSILHAGFYDVGFVDHDWVGRYALFPSKVTDSARLFTSGMYRQGLMECVSFHPTKHLGISTHGGAILHDNDEADEWLGMARFDGRKEGVEPRYQKEWVLGWHCYMNPQTAAEGLQRLSTLPEHNDPLPKDGYPDLSTLEIFK